MEIEVPFTEKYPHARLRVKSVELSDITDQHFTLLYGTSHKNIRINNGVITGIINKGIDGIIEPEYEYDIWYRVNGATIPSNNIVEILMALPIIKT